MNRVELDTRKLNRKILNVYWLIIFLAIIIKLINYNFTDAPLGEYLIYFVAIPGVIGALIVIGSEVAVRLDNPVRDFIVITAGLLIALNFIYSRPDLIIVKAALFLPILTSGAYFKKKIIIYTTVLTIVSYSILSVIDPMLRSSIGVIEHFTLLAMLSIAALAVIGITERGLELTEHYRQSIEDQQDLLVKNTLMEKLSKTDSLTGMYNQISFHQYLNELLAHHSQYHFSIQMAIFDLDNFKQVNDTYGHRAGDEVLKQIAELIQKEITSDDFAARYGGEEFIVLFVGKPMERTIILIEGIRRKIEGISFRVLEGSRVTVSIGVNEYETGMGKEAFFEKADKLLYSAKRNGKNQVKTG
ncbi:GGDEF domain-containing protein [Bacillus sp. Marseille-Q3570]|uniref:GGDEF domain-containing protein n=1 Tax=Bacillus sp. Marseille-Q3570 TaxID=2963522 RepID=UPI0021B71854|nr:GGDEF domain-containing protein [Bacillus sp. Marseille-Q3570]